MIISNELSEILSKSGSSGIIAKLNAGADLTAPEIISIFNTFAGKIRGLEKQISGFKQ